MTNQDHYFWNSIDAKTSFQLFSKYSKLGDIQVALIITTSAITCKGHLNNNNNNNLYLLPLAIRITVILQFKTLYIYTHVVFCDGYHENRVSDVRVMLIDI